MLTYFQTEPNLDYSVVFKPFFFSLIMFVILFLYRLFKRNGLMMKLKLYKWFYVGFGFAFIFFIQAISSLNYFFIISLPTHERFVNKDFLYTRGFVKDYSFNERRGFESFMVGDVNFKQGSNNFVFFPYGEHFSKNISFEDTIIEVQYVLAGDEKFITKITILKESENVNHQKIEPVDAPRLD